ncbi:hypothetical protein [Wolbachia endosymbiont of Pentidionis agamae]|uniref:hypothetical protein n=1 Tax=Wolbachia endosymbiont of Pentidionis agamae TaxID=3110435 RepID=UPI002FD461F8
MITNKLENYSKSSTTDVSDSSSDTIKRISRFFTYDLRDFYYFSMVVVFICLAIPIISIDIWGFIGVVLENRKMYIVGLLISAVYFITSLRFNNKSSTIDVSGASSDTEGSIKRISRFLKFAYGFGAFHCFSMIVVHICMTILLTILVPPKV